MSEGFSTDIKGFALDTGREAELFDGDKLAATIPGATGGFPGMFA